MRIKIATFFCIALCQPIYAQEVISLPYEEPKGIQWLTPEREYYSSIWETEVITNVAKPTLIVYQADAKLANGSAVIIAPGGALFAHSINSEGIDVAKWLQKRGVTAFVLKYRLVPTGEDGVLETIEDSGNFEERIKPVMPYAISDGLAAIDYVRSNSEEFSLEPDRIGFMGFSAGGSVTLGVTYNYTDKNRPDFIVPVYPANRMVGKVEVPSDAPPILLICASDDQLGLAQDSIDLYTAWLDRGKTAGLHMYSKGGHGFGMRKQNLPSDTWIERFYDWALAEKLIIPVAGEE